MIQFAPAFCCCSLYKTLHGALSHLLNGIFLLFSVAELEAEVSRLFEDETKQKHIDKELAEDF